MDTQMASLSHLSQCNVKGFMNFHSQKALDEGVLGKVDKQIFAWKKQAEKAAKEFMPEVTCSVDGYGGSNVHKTSRVKLIELMETKADAIEDTNIREKHFVVKDEEKTLVGKLRFIHEPGQEKVKTKLRQRIVNMPSFWSVAQKRKADVDLDRNFQFKCSRRTSSDELFADAWREHFYGDVSKS